MRSALSTSQPRSVMRLASHLGSSGISPLGVNDSFGPICSIPQWGLDSASRYEQLCAHLKMSQDHFYDLLRTLPQLEKVKTQPVTTGLAVSFATRS